LNLRANGLHATNGGNVIETDGFGSLFVVPSNGESVRDVIGTHVQAVEGKSYTIGFDFASRADVPAEQGSETDAFDVYWNGAKVGSFDPNSATWVHSLDWAARPGCRC